MQVLVLAALAHVQAVLAHVQADVKAPAKELVAVLPQHHLAVVVPAVESVLVDVLVVQVLVLLIVHQHLAVVVDAMPSALTQNVKVLAREAVVPLVQEHVVERAIPLVVEHVTLAV